VRKESMAEIATTSRHRLYLDLSKVTVKSSTPENVRINRDNWTVVVCEATGKKWGDFTVTKCDMVLCTCKHLNKLKAWNIAVYYI
jgi:hypothetical protein